MVILIEYGNEENIVLKKQVKRGILPGQLLGIAEEFMSQSNYRWGKMYSIVGQNKKLIRQL